MIPKIVYHGTSRTRNESIKRDKMLRADMPKYYANDDQYSMGYIYFTNNLTEAALWALNAYLTDIRQYEEAKAMSEKVPALKDGVVIALKTAGLNIEVDPEHYSVNQPANNFIKFTLGKDWNSTWYRHKGNIRSGHYFPYRITPYAQWGDIKIDSMNAAIDQVEIMTLAKKA